MAAFIESNIDILKEFVQNSNFILALIIGVSLIILESIIPLLPLAVFIAINMIAFGGVVGFIISWISTIIGCTISFYVFRKLKDKLWKRIEKRKKLTNIMNKMDKLSFSSLVIILAFPFTPAFSINIGAGLSNMNYRRYFFALLISKLSIVYFWGFIGTTLIESIKDISIIIRICLILLISFIISKIVMKKFGIE